MSFRNWFNRRKTPDSPAEITPGGSQVYHSLPPEQQSVGAPAGLDLHRFAREAIYTELFGPTVYIIEDPTPADLPIQVYGYPPGQNGRTFWTIVSGGMSTRPMNVPANVQGPANAREIILYANEFSEHLAQLVRFFARYPHRNNTWLGFAHTVTNGDPPTPLFDHSELVAVMMLNPTLVPDIQVGSYLEPTNEPLAFLWMVPITQAELDLKLNAGMDALMAVFDRERHPIVLNPQRRSYV